MSLKSENEVIDFLQKKQESVLSCLVILQLVKSDTGIATIGVWIISPMISLCGHMHCKCNYLYYTFSILVPDW